MTDFKIELVPGQMSSGVMTFEIRIVNEATGAVVFECEIVEGGKLRIYEAENLDPNILPEVLALVTDAVMQARNVADADWDTDGPDVQYRTVLKAAIKSGPRDHEEGLVEEGETKALVLSYRVMDDEREVQTGVVDWRDGIRLWDAEPIEMHELQPLFSTLTHICEKSKDLMVDQRSWD